MALTLYNQKRNFKNTPEPPGKPAKKKAFRFVIQRHEATRLHYDFRLELEGALKSWAVPKGPSLNPQHKRLAMMVEDHPVSYIDFEGTIPEGNYGAGSVRIWDKGEFIPVNEKNEPITETGALSWLEKGELKFVLYGSKLQGGFVLVKLKNDLRGNSWLLIKHRDDTAISEDYNSEDHLGAPKKNMARRAPAKNKTPADIIKKAEPPSVKPVKPKKQANDAKEAPGVEKNKTVTIGKQEVSLTNLSKVYWPASPKVPGGKITKGDLIAYYENIAPYILPYLKDRPLSLKRNPNGILDDGFYHKNAGESAPSWIKTAKMLSGPDGKVIHYIVCNDKASLLYIANLGSIEINPWSSTYKKPAKPGYMVIDIDPSDKNTFEEVIETARCVKKILDKAGAASLCKTSGASGLHVYIPLGEKYTYDEIKDFAKQIAVTVQQNLPETTSIVRSLTKRGDKIYVDYLQNRQGQTLASVYSVRPKPGATVSTPLEWKEVKPGLHPSKFTIHNIADRLKKKGDLFKGILQAGINLNECMKKLKKL